MNSPPLLFDRPLLKGRSLQGLSMHPLMKEVTFSLVERLRWIRRSFPVVCNLGSPSSLMQEAFQHHQIPFSTLIHTRETILCDEELLPFSQNTFDLIISCGVLHWVNDLPGVLKQILYSLKPDGLFLGTFIGGDSLRDLRDSFYEAEASLRSGVTPRVSPMIRCQDAATLLQRAGFTLPVVDQDHHSLIYDAPLSLMRDLKKRGQANALTERSKSLVSPTLLRKVVEKYDQKREKKTEVKTTIDVITLTGWKPSPKQQIALPRGTAQKRLAEALDQIKIEER